MAARLGTILGAAIVWFALGYFVGKDAKECSVQIKPVIERKIT